MTTTDKFRFIFNLEKSVPTALSSYVSKADLAAIEWERQSANCDAINVQHSLLRDAVRICQSVMTDSVVSLSFIRLNLLGSPALEQKKGAFRGITDDFDYIDTRDSMYIKHQKAAWGFCNLRKIPMEIASILHAFDGVLLIHKNDDEYGNILKLLLQKNVNPRLSNYSVTMEAIDKHGHGMAIFSTPRFDDETVSCFIISHPELIKQIPIQ